MHCMVGLFLIIIVMGLYLIITPTIKLLDNPPPYGGYQFIMTTSPSEGVIHDFDFRYNYNLKNGTLHINIVPITGIKDVRLFLPNTLNITGSGDMCENGFNFSGGGWDCHVNPSSSHRDFIDIDVAGPLSVNANYYFILENTGYTGDWTVRLTLEDGFECSEGCFTPFERGIQMNPEPTENGVILNIFSFYENREKAKLQTNEMGFKIVAKDKNMENLKNLIQTLAISLSITGLTLIIPSLIRRFYKGKQYKNISFQN